MSNDRSSRLCHKQLWISLAQRTDFVEREAGWHITIDEIMSGGLVCHDVRHNPARNDFGISIGSIPTQSDRERPALCACRIDHVKGRIKGLRLRVEITGLDALGDACRIDLDAEDS